MIGIRIRPLVTKVIITDKETGLEYGFVSLRKASLFMGNAHNYISHYCLDQMNENKDWKIKRLDIEEGADQ